MKFEMRLCAAILSIASVTRCLAGAAHPKGQALSVPFVGCASDGQVGPRKAPRGKSKIVNLPAEAASQLAYYQAEEGLGVLAPRGWRCFGTYGSNGDSLLVTPQAIDRNIVFSENWKGFSGPAIQVSDEFGGTSGRFSVARIVARVFPYHKAFVANVIAEGIEPSADFPAGPYPKDKLQYRSNEIVEFETPPWSDGLGTHSRLQKNDTAILGVAVLSGSDEELNLSMLFARLPKGSEALSSAIIQQVERDAAISNH